MSDTFTFEGVGSIHDSGTKYYQVIHLINNRTKKGVVVTHWGSMHPGAPREPKHHGQSKVDFLTSGVIAAANAARRNKQKRGYGDWEKTSFGPKLSELSFLDRLDSWFSRLDVETIRAHMVESPWESGESTDTVIFDEAESLIAAAPVIETPKSENWGTW